MRAPSNRAELIQFSWNPPTERTVRARLQAHLFAVVIWFGFCGVMLSGIMGTERFLLGELSLGAVTGLSIMFCVLGIAFAAGGSLSAIRFFLLHGRLRRAQRGRGRAGEAGR